MAIVCKKIVVNVIVTIVSVFAIALTIFICDATVRQRGYYVADSILGYLDPNQIMGWDNAVFTVVDQDPSNCLIDWKKSEIYQKRTVRLDIIDHDAPCVMGSCWSGKGELRREYPVLIDTGFTGDVLVTDSIVKDSRLGFYTKELASSTISLCHLCQLKIGEITFVHPLCRVRNGHYEKKVFWEDALIEHEILLGLNVLKSFKYILIDTSAEQIEFSMQDSFSAGESDAWRNFPMTVEKLSNNNYILLVTMSIAGVERVVQFDTGAATGVGVRDSSWDDFSKELEYKGPKRIRLVKVNGIERSEYYTVGELEFCGEVINDANIVIISDKDTDFADGKMLVGMAFFRESVVVLDFENGLLRVNGLLKSTDY